MRYEDRVPIQVLIVSSNSRLHQGILEKLEPPLWNAIVSESAAQAFEVLTKSSSDEGIMLLDEVLPDLEPNEFRGMVRLRFPQIQVLTLNSDSGHLLVGCDSPNPVSSRLVNLINRTGVVESFPRPPAARPVRRPSPEGVVPLRGMIGDSEPMQRAYGLTRMVAVRDTTVLVTGESGTGKDLIAQEIHQISQRRKQPFVVVNCSAIPETLLEAELFGYSKGSFTGALQSRIGRVHAAHGGTLFLDEIGDMPLSLQGKILRFLEQGEVQRLGGNDNLKVDVRVVAATNADLKSLAAKQQFREDLYYRLAVFPIHLAPLRERKGDLEALAVAFAEKFLPGVEVSRAALSVLEQYDWPGNVRELRNVMERSTILVGAGREIKSEHICI
jgi:DNA-binding NtrC family response regulator